jgi:hypothetical protein
MRLLKNFFWIPAKFIGILNHWTNESQFNPSELNKMKVRATKRQKYSNFLGHHTDSLSYAKIQNWSLVISSDELFGWAYLMVFIELLLLRSRWFFPTKLRFHWAKSLLPLLLLRHSCFQVVPEPLFLTASSRQYSETFSTCFVISFRKYC